MSSKLLGQNFHPSQPPQNYGSSPQETLQSGEKRLQELSRYWARKGHTHLRGYFAFYAALQNYNTLTKIATICPFLLNRLFALHWEAFEEYFMKYFLTERDYEVDSKKAGDQSLSNPASSPVLTPQHVMECLNRGSPMTPKVTLSEGLLIIHYLHNFAEVF